MRTRSHVFLGTYCVHGQTNRETQDRRCLESAEGILWNLLVSWLCGYKDIQGVCKGGEMLTCKSEDENVGSVFSLVAFTLLRAQNLPRGGYINGLFP